jgi:DNA-binding CsgD family transcriptional regulator
LLTHVQPHMAVQTRIELIRAHIALADISGARTLMQEVDEVLQLRPGLGILIGEAEALRARLARERGSADPGASALTAAELRLLPLISTHLTVPDIAAELYLSPHTIKSQLTSIYRKLGASTRNQAVTRARELGLLEGLRPAFTSSHGTTPALARGGLADDRRGRQVDRLLRRAGQDRHRACTHLHPPPLPVAADHDKVPPRRVMPGPGPGQYVPEAGFCACALDEADVEDGRHDR